MNNYYRIPLRDPYSWFDKGNKKLRKSLDKSLNSDILDNSLRN
jgi:hypothetical protein